MKNERVPKIVPRGIKMAIGEERWYYERFGVNEEPTIENSQQVKQTVLFDEGAMRQSGQKFEKG